MPNLNNLLDEEIPKTSKRTINKEVSKDVAKDTLNIYDLVKKEKRSSKEQVGVTLDKEIVDKLKTVVIDSNLTMSKLFESLLTPLLEDVVVKEKNVRMYNDKNKGKGNRTKK